MADRAFVSQFGEILSALGLLQNALCFLEKNFARRCQGDLFLIANQQFDTEVFFKFFDRLAERRLGHMQSFRRFTEVQFCSEGHKLAELPEIKH